MDIEIHCKERDRLAALGIADQPAEHELAVLADRTGLEMDRRVVGADLVVTGEGSLDDQSLAGKAPIGVARAAARSGVPVVAIAGRLRLSPQQLHQAGISAAYALTDLEPDLDRCIADASSLLQQIGALIAKNWLA